MAEAAKKLLAKPDSLYNRSKVTVRELLCAKAMEHAATAPGLVFGSQVENR